MPSKSRHFRLSALTLGTVALVGTGLVATSGTTLAASSSVKPVVAGAPYLALGDSIVFGYRESNNNPAPDYSNAANFKGYPEDIAAALGLDLTNASCPGETTSSMIDKNAASNGCENSYDASSGQQVPVGYRKAYPLHTSYKGSQLSFAEHFLKQHPGTRLVTLTIGANDGFLCQKQTSDGCISEFGDLQTKLKKNLQTIFKGIRGTGYKGRAGLYEVMALSPELRRMILRGASVVEIRDQAVSEGMLTLRMDGMKKIERGITTLEEVVKETAE